MAFCFVFNYSSLTELMANDRKVIPAVSLFNKIIFSLDWNLYMVMKTNVRLIEFVAVNVEKYFVNFVDDLI